MVLVPRKKYGTFLFRLFSVKEGYSMLLAVYERQESAEKEGRRMTNPNPPFIHARVTWPGGGRGGEGTGEWGEVGAVEEALWFWTMNFANENSHSFDFMPAETKMSSIIVLLQEEARSPRV